MIKSLKIATAILNLLVTTPGLGQAEDVKPSGRVQVAAKLLTQAQRIKLLDTLNSGDNKTLKSLPHIGNMRAAAIRKARPIVDVIDLIQVEGIGEQTFIDIIAYVREGYLGPVTQHSNKKN